MSLALSGFLAFITLLRQAFFMTAAWDMGYYIHAVWAIGQGSWENSVSGFHVFADHFSPIMLLLAPISFLGTAEGLMVIQALAVGSTVVPAFRIGSSLRDERLGWICVTWLGLSVAVWHTVMYDFRPATLGFVALVWLIAELEGPRRTWLVLALAALAVASREDVAMFTGIALLIDSAPRKETRFVLPGTLAVGVSVWYTTIGQRLFAPFEYFLWYRFADYGNGPLDALSDPGYLVPTAVERLIRPEVLFAIGALLIPSLILPAVRGWRRSWPGILIILANGISGAAFIPTIYYQYYILAAVFLIWGSAHFFADPTRVLRPRPIVIATILVFVIAGPVSSYGPVPYGRNIQDIISGSDRSVLQASLPALETGDSVSAGAVVLPHVAERHDVYSFPLPLVCGDVIQRYTPQTLYPDWVIYRPTIDDRHSLDLNALGYIEVGESELMEVWRSTGAHPASEPCPDPSTLREAAFERVSEHAAES